MMRLSVVRTAGGKCAVTAWGDWSACSVTCGVGQRVRKRRYHNPMVDENMCGLPVMEIENCIGNTIFTICSASKYRLGHDLVRLVDKSAPDS